MAKQRILLVEDDAIETMDIKRTLESFGYEVPCTASRGEEAVEKARKELPDLILMDIILKGELNGIEAANEINELEIPIIYLTAHSEEDTVQKAKVTGPYGYLIKPYDPFELRYAIELALYKNQMEKKLKESEKRYKSIVETANEGIWATDANFNINYVNPKLAEMLGYTMEEMLGKHVTFFIFEEDIPEAEKHIEKRIKGHPETYERRFKHKNGSEVSTIISVTALMDDNGDFVGSFAMFTDISHRKKMEKELKNRESQLNAIIDGSPVPQFVIDTNHRVMYWNKAMADYSGISSEEIIGTNNHWKAFYSEKRPCLADLMVQGNLDQLNKFYSGKFKESEHLKDAYEIEDFFPHVGEGKWLHLTAAAIKDSEGKIIGSLETIKDITVRKMAEKSAIDQYRFLQHLIDTIPYPVFYKDMNYVYMGCNKRFEEIIGLPKDEIVGKTVHDITLKESADMSHEKDKELFKNPGSQFYEEYVPYADGTMHLVLFNKTTFQNEKGQLAGIIGIMVDITERKKTENALKESEEKFRVLADNIPISIVVYQRDKVVYANDFAVQMSGYSKEELYTMNLWDNFYPDDQKLMMGSIKARLKGEKVPNRYEVRFITKSGDVRNIDLSAGFIIYDGQPADLITLTDITERKDAERDLQISQFSIENASDEIYWVDMDGDFIYANKSACDSLGFSKEEILSRNVFDVVPDFSQETWKNFAEDLRLKGSFSFETRHKTKDGRIFPVEINSNYMNFHGKEMIYTFSRDISQREKVLKSLRDSESKFRSFTENSLDTIMLFDSDLRHLYVNPNAEKVTGIPAEDFIGKTHKELGFPKDMVDLWDDALHNVFKTGENGRIEFELPSGAWMDWLMIPLLSDDGKVSSVITSARDITERKDAERDLQISQFSIENASDEIYWVDMDGNFIYANKSACDSLGFSKEEILSLKVFDIDPHYNPEKWRGAVNEIRKKGSFSFETRHKTKDGRIFPVEINTNYMNFHGKEMIYTFSRDISQREKVLKSLRDSESKFRSFTENSLDTIMLFDSDLRHLYVNPNAEKETGIPAEDFIGKTHKELGFPKDMVDLWDDALHNVFKTGENGRIEFELPSGAWIDWLMIPLLSDDGKVSSVITSARNITERKKMEENLKNSEAEYRAIFEGSKSAVAIFNVINDGSNFVFKDLNRSAEFIEQIKREDVIGKKVTDVFPSIKDFGLFEIFQSVWKTGKPEKHPVTIYQDERIKGWRENYVYKLPSGDMVAVYDDLTEIMQYEEELEKNQVRLKSMVRILQYNAESVQDLLDYALNEAITLSDSKIGYIFSYNEDKKQFILNNWSEGVMDECNITDIQTVYDLDKTGIWGEAVRQGKPIILNDFQKEHALKKGYPEGHAPLNKFMTIPIFSSDKIVAVVGVANKKTNYTETDALQLELLMDGVWKIVDTKVVEKALEMSEKRYKAIFENTGTAMAISDENMTLSLVNDEFVDLTGFLKKEIENKMLWTDFFAKKEVPRMKKYHRLRRRDSDSAPRNYETILKDRKGTLKDIYITVTMLPETNNSLFSLTDITEKKQSRLKLRKELKINQALAKIYVPLISPLTNIQDISEVILDEAASLSGSRHGFLAIIDPESKDLVNQTLSKKMPLVDVSNDREIPEEIRFSIGSDGRYHGLLGHCLNNKEAFYDNEAKKNHSVLGLPAEYWSIDKFLCVPVLIEDELVGEITLANPPGKNYSDEDLLAVKRLADFFALAIQRKRYEEQISKSLNEKELLLREIHHRVKNNMQIISSILNLQSFTVKDPNLQSILKQNQSRIKSMAMIHEKLYQSKNLVEIDFSEYLRSLTTDVFYHYSDKTKIEVDLDLDENIKLNIETSIPCGLIYTELLTNTIQHAFPGFKEGKISVQLKRIDDHIMLRVSDNGIGLPKNVNFRETSSLGLQLINSLVKQIEGTIELDQISGTSFTIQFQELKYDDRIKI